ncbi:restriction endonuclease subunit S [Pseudanabaena sp. ABRG5-3]|uniref:restriction endonuclease subunit S n=1 Tax=Pseudanabaena sp. ABRG5-3 TaxID=685565 RepID=UPI000DC72BC0|nr:restriction endonuclease subunit S [Pseudanabaena sp. ABRG5-3]BBC25442.1 type I restriction modification system, specificity subunit [Pseudanabaena sp. ABRG5-3]
MLKDWIEVELGDVCFTTSGGTPSRSKSEYYKGTIPWVKSGELNYGLILDTEEHISDEAITNSSAKIFPEGTLLIALYGATIGKLSILGVPATTNQAICGIYKNELFETKFLFNYLFHKRQKLIEQGTGGAQPNISQAILKKLSLPLAPLPEQRAITAKIEQLFSELDNGIANLKAAKSKLEIYRQAILKQAFEGELTKEWREKQTKNHGNHVNQKNHSTDSLPETWKWVKLENLAVVGTGATPKRGESNYWQNGSIAWITSGALNDLYVKEASEFITEAAIKETNCKIFPKGSLLIAMYGEGKTRGKCSELMISAATNQAIASIEINDEFKEYKKYVKWFLLKNYDDIRMLSSGGVQPNLNLTIVKNTKLPLCPIEEQNQIVQEIETRLSVCDKLNESIDQSLEKAQALRQSILKKAFEGKLLSQDELQNCRQQPDWEPAAKLLERVKKDSKTKR